MIQSQCRLKGVLEVARHAFLSELDRHTIGELAEPAGPLAALLGMGRSSRLHWRRPATAERRTAD